MENQHAVATCVMITAITPIVGNLFQGLKAKDDDDGDDDDSNSALANNCQPPFYYCHAELCCSQ